MRGKAGDGSILALDAIGPQDTFLLNDNVNDSLWNTDYKQPSNFSLTQRSVVLPGTAWIGEYITIEILPKNIGDLISNIHLKCSLPALPTGYIYTDQIGRAIIKQVDFMIDGNIIESITDDWYIIKDQMFLDADEKVGLAEAINGGYAEGVLPTLSDTQQINMIIPLDLFFCRRHSKNKKNRERLDKPYLPACALYNQRLYIKIRFNPWTWFCNSPTVMDFVEPPILIVEEIKLNDIEKNYILEKKNKIVINRILTNPPLFLNNGTSGQLTSDLTASFPVNAVAWVMRRSVYETDPVYVSSRYTYGYTTQNVSSGVKLNFFNGVTTNYVDVISRGRIRVNGQDIIDMNNGTYFTINQPLEHGLSIPNKSIYLYCFGLNPKEYNQGGFLDFSQNTPGNSTLNITFNVLYAAEIAQSFTTYLFYYGYTILEIKNGYGQLAFV